MKNQTVELELVKLERSYWQALKDRDFETALKLTDDPCIITGPQGIGMLDRRSLVKMMKDAKYKLDEFELADDIKVSMLTDNVAVVAYEVHEEYTIDGKTVMFDAADASTWIHRNGRWVCSLPTEAIEGDPFGRDRNGGSRARASQS